MPLEDKVYPSARFYPAAIRKPLAKEMYDSFNNPFMLPLIINSLFGLIYSASHRLTVLIIAVMTVSFMNLEVNIFVEEKNSTAQVEKLKMFVDAVLFTSGKADVFVSFNRCRVQANLPCNLTCAVNPLWHAVYSNVLSEAACIIILTYGNYV